MKTFSGKEWKDAQSVENLESLMSILLKNRNLKTHEEINDFLNPQLSKLHDPYLMHSMDKAVERILTAIQNEEKIIVYGDFDADGVTSTVILVDGLRKLGARVSYRIPERNTDGHGLKNHIIDEIATKEVSLIISCDCGINDKKQVDYAVSLGMDVIISDHHEPEEAHYPDQAIAVLNPHNKHCHYPETVLSGAGVVFKIITALAQEQIQDPNELSNFLLPYLEIAAIGLIGDCMPLTGETRIITNFGLQKIKQTSWSGLAKLLERNGIDPGNIDAETVGFYIAPKINAASRLGDVLKASELFLGDPSRNYERLTYLENLNNQRRELTKGHIDQAQSKIEENVTCQFMHDKDWTIGILGLMGSALSEKLNHPIYAGKEKENGMVNFSARAPDGFSIIDGMKSCDPALFEGFGGHRGAGGFQAKKENLPEIKKQLQEYYDKIEPEKVYVPVEAHVHPKVIDFELTEFLDLLGPFGRGNPNPNFVIKQAKLISKKTIGKENNHLKITVNSEGKSFELIGFFVGEYIEKLKIGDLYDVSFNLSENFWQGKKRLQLKLVDIRVS